jgi:hypothetical protein
MTPEEAERLEMLAEEAAEVIFIIMKTLRHGYESFHPDNPEITNRQMLEEEIGDFLGILGQMELKEDVSGYQCRLPQTEKVEQVSEIHTSSKQRINFGNI